MENNAQERVESIFMITLTVFDVYCLAEASPGSTHYRYFGFSFLFVYSGNQHVRNLLITVSVISFVISIALLVTSVMMVMALRKDLYYSYHQAVLIIWILLIAANVFAWLIVYSNYQELTDITKLEDMAKLKLGTLSSLNASRSVSHHSIDSMKNSHSMTPHNISFQSTTSAKGSLSTASA
ncbi:hypothetical protein HPB51_012925 [Rhipicephalus microplus]|uniref:Uncharacterized protein n=1 Tax=Rhipicephalus microplus TaxID=6941 RepID=A0A9J6F2A2_RHIMP|nr:hypothetical protein HPB51_012925 [Rhipicephalus microplus]